MVARLVVAMVGSKAAEMEDEKVVPWVDATVVSKAGPRVGSMAGMMADSRAVSTVALKVALKAALTVDLMVSSMVALKAGHWVAW